MLSGKFSRNTTAATNGRGHSGTPIKRRAKSAAKRRPETAKTPQGQVNDGEIKKLLVTDASKKEAIRFSASRQSTNLSPKVDAKVLALKL